ncbi:prolipoprotein diacylglyceryl transferase [Chitinophaga sp. XS-30]|uniref:prolipoprotein diacylglyceryl transferase n=1 Tax=Chitinophaga sp. XS-30 TaxID=2604421 RepID=UPI0011DCE102|nr:prolipoprotein diacylglyceryl transferase family protein [Chitinophaga sp. XS-30]QEH41745.1 diacylglyceryl transferase [Chitinophaga sp. XS-30]
MYPNLYYAFKDLFGIEIPVFKILQTFGFFVAVAFLAAAYVLTSELRRRERLGLLSGVKETITVGKPASVGEMLISAVIGFILGFKLLGLIPGLGGDSGGDLRAYILSGQGSLIGGLLGAGVMAYWKYSSKKKTALDKPKQEEVLVMPHQRVPDFTIQAAVAGLIGAKIFHNLENWGEFTRDPWGSLFSASGLTFYGGLIVAAYVIIRYARKKNIHWKHLVDSAAPALMLAYAVGRMGCQFSGDGDWGINNSAYGTNPTGKVEKITAAQYQEILHRDSAYFVRQFGSLENVPHRSFEKPASLDFLPDFFFAYSYPHNVVNDGMPLQGCDHEYCSALPVGVFPTPLYEIIVCGLFFVVLMAIRKKVTTPGVIFGIYLILNGIERFFVEKIRVNTKYDIFGFHPTQAEIIASLLVIGGAVLIWYARKTNPQKTAQSTL